MEKYIGAGFVILCLTLLVGIIGILGYQIHIHKKIVDIRPTKADDDKPTTNEWGLSPYSFYLLY